MPLYFYFLFFVEIYGLFIVIFILVFLLIYMCFLLFIGLTTNYYSLVTY
jgi:hypothetical protein